MREQEPSRTALSAARHRAAHQISDGASLFCDPLAVAILSQSPRDIASDALAHPERRAMRLFIAARTAFAEAKLSQAVGRGARQLVVLGAGLDTFGYRNPYADLGLRVFEVDHPATQAWKRRRLAEAAIIAPPSLTFAPVDFERESLSAGLARAGFDEAQPVFFTWLGVVPYLTDQAVFATLATISARGASAEVVFDYSDPPERLSGPARERRDRRAARVAALGEPWLSHFDPATLRRRLHDLGFSRVEDLGPGEIAARFLGDLGAAPGGAGGHLMWAAHP